MKQKLTIPKTERRRRIEKEHFVEEKKESVLECRREWRKSSLHESGTWVVFRGKCFSIYIVSLHSVCCDTLIRLELDACLWPLDSDLG